MGWGKFIFRRQKEQKTPVLLKDVEGGMNRGLEKLTLEIDENKPTNITVSLLMTSLTFCPLITLLNSCSHFLVLEKNKNKKLVFYPDVGTDMKAESKVPYVIISY